MPPKRVTRAKTPVAPKNAPTVMTPRSAPAGRKTRSTSQDDQALVPLAKKRVLNGQDTGDSDKVRTVKDSKKTNPKESTPAKLQTPKTKTPKTKTPAKLQTPKTKTPAKLQTPAKLRTPKTKTPAKLQTPKSKAKTLAKLQTPKLKEKTPAKLQTPVQKTKTPINIKTSIKGRVQATTGEDEEDLSESLSEDDYDSDVDSEIENAIEAKILEKISKQTPKVQKETPGKQTKSPTQKTQSPREKLAFKEDTDDEDDSDEEEEDLAKDEDVTKIITNEKGSKSAVLESDDIDDDDDIDIDSDDMDDDLDDDLDDDDDDLKDDEEDSDEDEVDDNMEEEKKEKSVLKAGSKRKSSDEIKPSEKPEAPKKLKNKKEEQKESPKKLIQSSVKSKETSTALVERPESAGVLKAGSKRKSSDEIKPSEKPEAPKKLKNKKEEQKESPKKLIQSSVKSKESSTALVERPESAGVVTSLKKQDSDWKDKLDKRSLFVKNISREATSEDLKELSKDILEVLTNTNFGQKSIRYATLRFKDENVAEKNYKLLAGKKLKGKEFMVDYAGSKSKNCAIDSRKKNALPDPLMLYVTGIPSTWKENDLHRLFPKAKSVHFPKTKKHRKQFGSQQSTSIMRYGFAAFSSEAGARLSHDKMQGKMVDGNTLVVMFAHQRAPRQKGRPNTDSSVKAPAAKKMKLSPKEDKDDDDDDEEDDNDDEEDDDDDEEDDDDDGDDDKDDDDEEEDDDDKDDDDD